MEFIGVEAGALAVVAVAEARGLAGAIAAVGSAPFGLAEADEATLLTISLYVFGSDLVAPTTVVTLLAVLTAAPTPAERPAPVLDSFFSALDFPPRPLLLLLLSEEL